MPVDRTIRKHIEDVVREWIGEGKMFSAFEISLAVKEKGVRERHRNMKDTVHEVIADVGAANGYSRTLLDVGAPVQAWVYHRMRDNPYNYEPLERHDSGARQTTRGAAAAAPSRGAAPSIRNPRPLRAGDALPALADDGAFGCDQHGRLMVPVSMVARLGVAAGETANIECDSDNAEVRVTRPSVLAQSTPDVALKVNDDGALRLEQDVLDKASLAGLQCYHIDSRGNMITIRKFDD